MPTEDNRFLQNLEVEVEVELDMAWSSHADEVSDESPPEWLVDPTEVERLEVGLGSLLDAIEVLETNSDDQLPEIDPGAQDADPPTP